MSGLEMQAQAVEGKKRRRRKIKKEIAFTMGPFTLKKPWLGLYMAGIRLGTGWPIYTRDPNQA